MAETDPAVARGVQWLAGQIQPDGTVGAASASLATPLQSAAESARALKLFGPVPVALVDRIAADADANTEYLARRIFSLNEAQRDAAPQVRTLAVHQNADGGFGGAQYRQSNTLDTSFALAAMKNTSQATASAPLAVTYLLQAQNENGSFPFVQGEASIYVTALASSALQSVSGNIQAQMAAGRANAWLLQQQDANGSWGSVVNTCLVQLALLGMNSDSALQTLVSASILAQQDANGSWGGDPYVTALALRALATRPQAGSATGSIGGQLIDGRTGIPLAGATVTVAQAPGNSVTTDASGKFLLTSVPSGSSTLIIAAAGHAQTSLEVVVRSGMTVDAGVLSLQSANTGTLQGTIKNGASNLPLADAVITVSGSDSAKATTKADGTYILAGITAGSIHIVASKPGFAVVTADGTIPAGNTIVFNTNLEPLQSSATLTGRIVDRETALPLKNVAVSISALGLASSSGADGRFALAGIPGGALRVELALAGYAATAFTVTSDVGVNVDVQTISMTKTGTGATTATVQGVVRDAVTGVPLQGVWIRVIGTTEKAGTSGADGSFVVTDVPPGAVTLRAVQTGYATFVAQAIAVAGETILFSPRLAVAVPASVTGLVVDRDTLSAIAGVAVSADGKTATTDQAGRFVLTDMPKGQRSIRFEAPGYAWFERPLGTDGVSVVNMQTIKLAKSTIPMVVEGKITDANTGQAIPKALVNILGTTFSAVSDGAGNYKIEGVPQGAQTVRYSAVGFIGETVIFQLSPYDTTSHDRQLVPGQATELRFEVATDKPSYGAYSPVLVQAKVANLGPAATTGMIGVVIYDAENRYVDSFTASRVDSNGVKQSVLSFAPGENDVVIAWNTAIHAPGRYTAIARILKNDTGDTFATTVEIAQKRFGFDIEATSQIESVQLTPLPAYTNLGAEEQLGYRVDVVNRSNVNVASTMRFELRNPQLQIIDSGTFSIDLIPAESTKSFALPGVKYKFAGSGIHLLAVEAVTGVVPITRNGGQISAAPGTRIEATETVAPNIVAPDGPKRIRIELRLKGVEQK